MSNQFKPGDLALIINTLRSPQYIGKTVELVRFVRKGEKYQAGRHELRAEGEGWVCRGDLAGTFSDRSGIHQTPGTALVDQKCLMPLRGDLEPKQQKAKEAEPCA